MKADFSKKVIIIILLAFLVRITFTLFFAETYFGKENFYLMGDSSDYLRGAVNLVEYGTYRTVMENPQSVVSRLPGYPIIFSGIYIIAGKNLDLAILLLIILQIIIDTVSTFLIFKLTLSFCNKKRISIIVMLLYAFYPFVIVWVPVISTEIFAVFFALLGLLFLNKNRYIINSLFGGGFLAASVLMRPQNMPLIFIFIIILTIFKFKRIKPVIVKSFIVFVGFSLVYSPWVIRNYILTDKPIVFTKIAGTIPTFNKDVVAVRKYIYSIKSEWDPQFFQIVRNEEVDWPEIAFISQEDSLMLKRAEYLAKNCGSGISYWAEYWNKENARMPDSLSCNDSIVYYFNTLRNRQIEANPFNYYVKIPLKNFSKALFKTSYVKEKRSIISLIGNLLFVYRSLLLIMGLIGVFIMMWKKNLLAYVIFIFWGTVYFYLCFVTRNLEMRYFLNNDVLMLIPAAFLINYVLDYLKNKKAIKNPDY